MPKLVIVGGGFAGCAAAAAGAKAGASVTLLERMEVLGGCGLFSGVVDNNSFSIREEMRFMGGDDIFLVIDKCALHKNVKFPWPKPNGAVKTLFDVTRIDTELREYLEGGGVQVRRQSRASGVNMDGGRIRSLLLDDGTEITGDVFVDATGGAGGIKNCQKYGNGCVMCFMRCPAFGDRVSIAAKAGVKELLGKKMDGAIGPTTAACNLLKETMSPALKQELETTGRAFIPLPQKLIDYKRTGGITASVNIDDGFAENVVLADIGAYAKRIAASYAPLDEMRMVPGLEHVRYIDPYAGTVGNAVRFMSITPRGDALNVPGVDNLFVASEKLGISGIVTTILTGMVAGHNAARQAAGMAPLVFPRTTMLGDFLAFLHERWNTEEGLRSRVGVDGGAYMNRAIQSGLYTEDSEKLRERITASGLLNIFSQRVTS